MGTSQSYHFDSNDNKKKNSPLYPQVIDSNPEAHSSSFQSKYPKPSSSLYPTIDMTDLAEKLFPDPDESAPTAPMESVEEVLVNIPGSIVHLIDKQSSVELASGDLTIVRIRQNQNVVAVLARIGDQIQWPLAKDEAAVKLDDSHYFFSLHVPSYTGEGYGSSDEEEKKKKNKKKKSQNKGSKKEDEEGGLLNYGLTIASKGQEGTLREFDAILDKYSSFSVQKVSSNSDMLDGSMAKGVSPSELNSEKKKNTMMKDASAAYWTTLAPNVEDYSGSVARAIAAGSGQLIKGILWCGDVTVDRLKWGHDFCKKRTNPCSKQSEVSPETLKRIKRVKRMTKMSEKVATGVLSGVVKVSGFFTSSIVNSKPGKKFFSLLPGEIVLASLDGFSKVCDAAEVAGRNVMSTSSTVTTGLVSHRYGEKAGEATNEGLDAAGHAVGAAWAVFKIRKAFNPKSAIKPTTIVKSAAKAAVAEVKSRK